ncbi:MAG: phosphotransferase [Halioglobus sp.]|nr:phosphotransferase [Halioglobus sp.]
MFIPEDLQSLSKEWLSQVLATPVAAFSVVDSHAGTTGRALLEMQYGEATRLPLRLFVKLPPTDELQRAFVVSSGMGLRESRFYSSLSDEVPVRVPRCYFAAGEDSGEQYIMLLENLDDTGCTFQNAANRYSMDYVHSVLKAFAALHAAFWDSPRFATDLSWVQPPLQHDIALQLIALSLERHAADMPPVFNAMGDLYLSRADDIHQLWQSGCPTLIHGDVHDANLFCDGDTPGFLDWALVARGSAMRDVGYFLAGTLTKRDQLEFGRKCIDYYRQQLLALSVPAPGADLLWQQYQWHAAYVWVGAAVTLAMGDAWQPRNYVLASLEKLHTAMELLGSVDAIRAALP